MSQEDTLNLNRQNVDKYSREFVDKLVFNAADLIAPAWSLKKFVASNPLKSLESLSFERASSKAREYFDAKILPDELIAFNALKKGDLSLENLEKVYSTKISKHNLEFEFRSKKIKVKEFVLNAVHRYSHKYLEIVEDAEMSKFIEEIASSYRDIFVEEKTHFLISEKKGKKFYRKVNATLIRWLERFYDEGQASIEMPYREKGIFAAWKELALLKNLSKEQKKIVKNLPEDSSKALIELLISLEINEEDWEEYLRMSFLALPGWSSYIQWKVDYQADKESSKIAPPSLTDFLALRLTLEKIFCLDFKQKDSDDYFANNDARLFLKWSFRGLMKSGFSKKDLLSISLAELEVLSKDLTEIYLKKGFIYLEAIEKTVNDVLKERISRSLNSYEKVDSSQRPEAQMVFCIDVRSEPFRKAIESQGDYQTFGYAGFFGVPVKYNSIEDEESYDSCPALIKPKHEVDEETFEDRLEDKFKKDKNTSFIKSIARSFKDLKVNFASIFVYSEASGLIYAFRILLKTIFPKLYFFFLQWVNKVFIPKIHYQPVLKYEHGKGISTEDQLSYARNALRMIGLTDNFAKFVIFCGHGSRTVNNPYSSALDCGACGGAHGGPNAKVIAKILNSSLIREELLKENINIPADTVFLGAEHNTTDDSVEIYNSGHSVYNLSKIEADLKSAKSMNNSYRMMSFSNSSNPDLRSYDWSEARPEWGLAGNSSFIIAPRNLTKDIDLGSRSFLHSYEYEEDEDGSILEAIMTAPMVVTQWINAQYYFSTVDNVNFGSGSKITHNVMGTCAVVQGNSSDLMHGLALQSVNSSDTDNFHSPVRITNYIYAPFERVKAIVDKHEMLQQFIDNDWIKVVVIEPETKDFKEYV